jgi:hypothetical protein
MTVLRTHVSASLPFSSTTAGHVIGFIVGRTDDVGVGSLRPPSPLNDPELEWALNTKVFASASGATADAVRNWTFDLRSKRKLEQPGQRYLLCVHNSDTVAATYSFYMRTLVALP